VRASDRDVKQDGGDEGAREQAKQGERPEARRDRVAAVLHAGHEQSECDGEKDHARNLARERAMRCPVTGKENRPG
jgi:hypothetical protein